MINSLDHLIIAVKDIDLATENYKTIIAMILYGRENVNPMVL